MNCMAGFVGEGKGREEKGREGRGLSHVRGGGTVRSGMIVGLGLGDGS